MKKAMKKPMSKKADINKNKKIEPWEAARSRAIAKSMAKKKGPVLSVGRGEKLPVSQGAKGAPTAKAIKRSQ